MSRRPNARQRVTAVNGVNEVNHFPVSMATRLLCREVQTEKRSHRSLRSLPLTDQKIDRKGGKCQRRTVLQ
jgi:hypothetical protein